MERERGTPSSYYFLEDFQKKWKWILIGKNLVSECLQAPRVREPPANKQTEDRARRGSPGAGGRSGWASPDLAVPQSGVGIAHPALAAHPPGTAQATLRLRQPGLRSGPPLAQYRTLPPTSQTAKAAGSNSVLQNIFIL